MKSDEDTSSINDEILIGIMLESRLAVTRAQELVDVPGVDAVVVGLTDLAADLGLGAERSHRLVRDQVEAVVQVCRGRGVAVGLHTYDLAEARDWIGKGIRMPGYSSDVAMVVDHGMKVLADLRSVIAARESTL